MLVPKYRLLDLVLYCCLFLVLNASLCVTDLTNNQPYLSKISLPEGFKIELYAENVENARSMVMSDANTLFVGSRGAGKVYALPDRDGDHLADTVITLLEDLNMPNGVALVNGALFVAEVDKVSRIDHIENDLHELNELVIVNDVYPEDRHHGWKYMALGPDGKIYVPVGAPCNICKEEDPIYASITRMNTDGTEHEIFAEGIRNSVGFTWHPETDEMWFTDNGRDMMGDDMPNDELNHAPEKGLHFGYPYCHAGIYPDPEFGNDTSCYRYAAPAQKLGAHVASLGLKFYTGSMFPEEYRNDIFIAEHGSWNRSEPSGYRITRVKLQGDRAISYDVFAEGWLEGNSSWGRPVDILILKDGSMLVSDDSADAIYRISYQQE